MAISGKVSAASVGAGVATVVSDIVARHLGAPVPADVLALIGASITAGVTFVCGYLARHVPASAVDVVKDVIDVATGEAPSREATPLP